MGLFLGTIIAPPPADRICVHDCVHGTVRCAWSRPAHSPTLGASACARRRGGGESAVLDHGDGHRTVTPARPAVRRTGDGEDSVRFLLALALAIFALGAAAGFGAAGLAVAHPPAVPAVVARYMEALRRHDGKQIWASYSPAFQARRIQEGDSEEATIALFDRLRREGASIDEEVCVGGYQAQESGYFLCVTRHFRPNQAPIEVVWIFQTDGNGLIDRIVV
jgi:hypothetical protein